MVDPEIVPVGPDQLDVLSRLFRATRTTRHCWCTAFCSTSSQFALGWYGGGNRRRFEAMASSGGAPMGVLALVDGCPEGWCGLGPRSRYTAALTGRSRLLTGARRDEDEDVWLIPCLVLRPGPAAVSVIRPLLRAATILARDSGAVAIEAWPLARGTRRPALDHVGREGLFTPLGFRRVRSATPQRVIMRLELRGRTERSGRPAPPAPAGPPWP